LDSREVNQIEEFYGQDAKFTEREKESDPREIPGKPCFALCELGVLAVNFFNF
jgi:hypothetical protein